MEIIEFGRFGPPDGYAKMPQLAMWHALHPGAIWPDGAVLVQSLPF